MSILVAFSLKRQSYIKENSTQSHQVNLELRNKPHKKKLRELKLLSIENRLLGGQLIEVFKIMNGFDSIKFEDLFKRTIDKKKLEQIGLTPN